MAHEPNQTEKSTNSYWHFKGTTQVSYIYNFPVFLVDSVATVYQLIFHISGHLMNPSPPTTDLDPIDMFHHAANVLMMKLKAGNIGRIIAKLTGLERKSLRWCWWPNWRVSRWCWWPNWRGLSFEAMLLSSLSPSSFLTQGAINLLIFSC